MDEETVSKLSPGIRRLVVWLNHKGFKTTDSGDGSNHANGMEGAMSVPMAYIKCDPHHIVADSHDLKAELLAILKEGARPMIEARYSPMDKQAGILLLGISDISIDWSKVDEPR